MSNTSTENIVDKYFRLRKSIFDKFGYQEDWRHFPIEDYRDVYWTLDRSESSVTFAETEENLRIGLIDLGIVDDEETRFALKKTKIPDYYQDNVYTYRHLSRYVYPAHDYTMILVDTYTDGNILLKIFDNKKERTVNGFEDRRGR